MNGRKRHLLVDTLGLVLMVVVHAANVSDREGARVVLAQLPPRLRDAVQHLWVDAGYPRAVRAWITDQFGWSVVLVRRPPTWGWVPIGTELPPRPAGFQVLPRRWVVERTFAWLGRWRRLTKDYEELPATSEAWIYLAMSRMMLARLVRPDATVSA